jgi:hypothetical protein
MGWVVIGLEVAKLVLSLVMDLMAEKRKAKAELDVKKFWQTVQLRVSTMRNQAIKEAAQAQDVENQIDNARKR